MMMNSQWPAAATENAAPAAPSVNDQQASGSEEAASMTLNFRRLLQKSQQLNAKVTAIMPSLPHLQRGLEQIEALSTKLAAKTAHISTDFRMGSLLATKGFDSAKVSENLAKVDLATSFESITHAPLQDTDVEGYLQRGYEQTILDAIQQVQRDATKDLDALINRRIQADWEKSKRAFLEKHTGASMLSSTNAIATGGIAPVSGRADGSAIGTADETSDSYRQPTRKKILASPKSQVLVQVVHKINDARVKSVRFAAATAFSNAIRRLDTDMRSDQLTDCWDTVAAILQEEGEGLGHGASKEADNIFVNRESISTLYKAPLDSGDHFKWRKHLTSSSRSFLEGVFLKFIDKTVAQYPRDAMLGGRPSILDKVRAFMNIRIKRMTPVELDRIEVIAGVPVWAYIFYLARCGHWLEAFRYAQSMDAHIQRSEPNFTAYIKAFLESEDRHLTGAIRAQIQSDYSQHLIIGGHDPYKLALLKILGRCDLGKKSIPFVIQSTEDYLWLQLCLVKETQVGATSQLDLNGASAYSLTDLQRLITEYGPKHFNPSGTNPLLYFHLLLLTGQFEKAIVFLYESSTNQVDAIHFAIALAFHGTLNFLDTEEAAEWDLLKVDAYGKGDKAYLNFSFIISSYAKSIQEVDHLEAIQYLLLISLGNSPNHANKCQALIREAVLSSGDFGTLLGDARRDGTISDGYLSKYSKLMMLPDESAFILNIMTVSASQCEREGRFREAIQLYNLAEEYDKVVCMLNERLSKSFSEAYSEENIHDVVEMASSIFDYYTKNPRIQPNVTQKHRQMGAILLRLLEFKRACHMSDWLAAINLIESVGIIPLEGDVMAVSRSAESLKQIDDPIATNIPTMLLLTMTALHNYSRSLREFASIDPGRQQQLAVISHKSRTVMRFVGMIQSRISPDVCSQLTRMDMDMN